MGGGYDARRRHDGGWLATWAACRAQAVRRSRSSKPASSARSITRSSKRTGPTTSSTGSRTTSTATPAMKRRSTIYVQKKWLFTVMKIDTMQMKTNKDGTFDGEVTPTRFQFTSEKLVYPLKITQISVQDKTEALFYVQAPFKVDLPGDMTYQYTWVPMLQAASGCTPGGLPGKAAIGSRHSRVRFRRSCARRKQLEFRFVSGQRPQPNKKGHIPTTMEWARKLTEGRRQGPDRQGPLQRKGARTWTKASPSRRQGPGTRQGDRQGHPRSPGEGAARAALRLPGPSCPGGRREEPAATRAAICAKTGSSPSSARSSPATR